MNSPNPLTPKAFPAGLDGVVVRFALTPEPVAMAAAQVLAAQLEQAPPRGTIEIAPALVSVLLRFDGSVIDRKQLTHRLLTQAQTIAANPPALPDPVRRWTIPAAFGGNYGPQLTEIAQATGQSESAAIQELCQTDLRVLAIGFAPGQPYLGLLPERWNLPRMSELNPHVPAGALVSAVRQLVMFTSASATGWRHIAQTGFRCFDPQREAAMPLRSGDAIRYAPVSEAEMQSLANTEDGLGGARLEVLR